MSVFFHVLEVLAELFDIPFELSQQQEAPSFLQGGHFLGSFEEFVDFVKEGIIGQDLVLFGSFRILMHVGLLHVVVVFVVILVVTIVFIVLVVVV